MHAGKAASSEAATGVHAAKATAVHAAGEATAMHAAAAAEAAAMTTTAATTATEAAASPESRRCESKGGGDHASHQAIKRSVIHPIPPSLNCSGRSRRSEETSRANSFDDFK